MDHIAIMKKEWDLLSKILRGEKTVESRWYMARYAPWDRIEEGDVLYFKNSGEPVTIKSRVNRVEQYEVRDSDHALEILKEQERGLGVEDVSISDYVRDKKYAIFISFDNIEEMEPFEIDKAGFGIMAAWLIVENINNIKK